MTTTTLAHSSLHLPSTLRTSGHATPNHGSRSNTPLRVKRVVQAQPDASLSVDADPDVEGRVRRSSSTTILDAQLAGQLSIGRRRRLSVTTFGDSEAPTPRDASATIIDAVLLRRQALDVGLTQDSGMQATSLILELQMPLSSYAVVGPDATVAQAVGHLKFPTVRCVVVAEPGVTHVLTQQDVELHSRDRADPFTDTLGSLLAGCPPPPAVFPSASVAATAGLLLECGDGVQFVPVVQDGTGNFLGLVSRTDLAEVLLCDRRHVYDAPVASTDHGGAVVPVGGEANISMAAVAATPGTVGAGAVGAAAHSAPPHHPHHVAHLLHYNHHHPHHLSPPAGPSDGSPRAGCNEPGRLHHPQPHPQLHPCPPAEPPPPRLPPVQQWQQQQPPATATAALAVTPVAVSDGAARTGVRPPAAGPPSLITAGATAAVSAMAAAAPSVNAEPSGRGGNGSLRLDATGCHDQLLLPGSCGEHPGEVPGRAGQAGYQQQGQQQQQQHGGSEGSVEHQAGCSADSLRSVSDPIRSGWDMLDNVDDALDVLGLVGKTVNAEAVGKKLLSDVAGVAANVAGGSSGTGWLFKYLYDGDCAICRTFQAIVEKLDNGVGRVIFVDISSQGFNSLEHGGINYRAAIETMHILSANGQIFKGVTAVIKLLAAVDADLAANMGMVTTVLPLLSLAYVIVSKNRRQLSDVWAQVLQATRVDRALFGRDILGPLGMGGSGLGQPAGSPRGR